MLLKKIEIHGFKSFADKTEFEMGSGVTCLVGPNGCGKSNVVDAVKWALGEQRPTALRGDNMGDVVFKGNGSRPAMGFAEVTLVFDNESAELPIETAEVAISRRLFRSGDSEYLINRHPCRLKDVRELFFDTGLGQNAYAVLEQGRIDAILNANPVERRSIFEEAAGIQRFRVRKREASRRLEKVDQNLLRVADLIEELEKRVRSLRIQAGRARSYVTLSDRLTELKMIQYMCAGAEMSVRAGELEKELQEARDRDRATEEGLAESSLLVQEADAEAQVVRDAIARKKNRKIEVRAEHDNSVTRRSALEQRERESREAFEERGRQLERLTAELADREEEAVRLENAIVDLNGELKRAESQVTERREALARIRHEANDRDARLGRLEGEIMALADDELELSNSLASLESRARGLRSSRERLVRREAELSGLLDGARRDLSAVQVSLSRLDEQSREESRSIAGARQELGKRVDREADLLRRIAAVQAAVTARESRRETLDGVIEKMEGVDEGSRAVVKAARENPDTLPGVLGLLAELLSVSRDRARAVDAALGHLAGAVVVESRAALDASLLYLRQENRGAATFLVLDAAAPAAEDDGRDLPGVALLDGVEFPAEFAELCRSVLGAVRVVDRNTDLLAHLGSGSFLVTTEGARLEASGAYSDQPGGRTIGFVERKVERDHLIREVEELCAEQRRLEEENARVAGEVTEWTANVAEAEQRKRDVDAGIVEGRSRDERLCDRATIYRRELAVSARERLDVETDEHSVFVDRRQAEASLGDRRGSRVKADTERRRLTGDRDASAELLDRLATEEASAANEVVRLAERVRGVAGESAMLRRAIGEQQATRDRIREERSELERRAEEAGREASSLEEIISGLREEEVVVRTELAELSAREERTTAAASDTRERAMAAAGAREESREALHQLQLSERELQLGQSSLRERAREEISLDIDERLADFDFDQAPPTEEVGRELSVVKDKISRIGNVNLDAINELEEVEKRLVFLSGEKEDLDNSRKSLMATIAELDSVSRVRFQETFDAVREHFRALFRRLFHGGKADVFLQEGVDVLDAGIEIMAGPPGKDPRSITLLSGGERTMTAVGLLFALFKAKPAPVAILDEVDAALDEANIERFCNLLGDFIGTSQFMIVTHSKRTMNYADVIFGVTMEESGVSKRIGIRLEEYEERVA